MNFDLKEKIIAASLATALIVAPVGVRGLKSWRAHAATPPVNTLAQSATDNAASLHGDANPPTQTDSTQGSDATIDDQRPLWQDYQVVEGDTLSGLAGRFGLSVETITASNGLDESAVLAIGQELLIPSTDGVVHQTTDGDSLWYLASLYQVSLESILQANPEINPDTLAPEIRLFIPGAKPIRDRQEVANRGSGGQGSAPVANLPAAAAGSNSAFGLWPTSGMITSYYGWRDNPVYGGGQFHKGIDIGAPAGEPVVAVASGRVVMAGSYGGYGLTVMVDHQNGLVTRYSHLSRIDVSEGQRVSASQKVGAVGSTGQSTGPHLDFGVSVGGQTADPLEYLP